MDLTTEDILKSINKPKLPMQPLGMPGAGSVLGLAQNTAKAVPEYLKDIYSRMKTAVTKGPYNDQGEVDPKIATLPLEVMMPGYGRAVGLGAMGGNVSKFTWSPEKVKDLLSLEQKYLSEKVRHRGSGKLIHREFTQKYPDYHGDHNTLQRQLHRVRTSGANIETGATPSKDIELGAFGGRGRLNTDSPGEAIGRLQEQLPVTKQWVEEWAKDANVPIKSIRGQDTQYIKLEGQKRPGDKDVTVRIPQDEARHFGSDVKKSEIGNLFDTGLSDQKPSGGKIRYRPRNEYTRINESAMPYAHPEALDAALKWRLSKAPHGGNWLIPEEMAPRLPQPRQQTPVNRDFIDLNQQILELLKRQ